MNPAAINARWTPLCRSVSPTAAATTLARDWLPRILAHYAEPRRHYHTFAHIAARPRLYLTDFFSSRLESQARANLTRSLQKLETVPDPSLAT